MNTSVNTRFSRLVSSTAFIVLFFAFSFTKTVAQNTVNYTNNSSVSIGDEPKNTEAKSTISEENNFNFVSWFMGTKESIKEERINSSSSSTKVMLINARIAPNRLLMKAFLKKTQNQNSTLA